MRFHSIDNLTKSTNNNKYSLFHTIIIQFFTIFLDTRQVAMERNAIAILFVLPVWGNYFYYFVKATFTRDGMQQETPCPLYKQEKAHGLSQFYGGRMAREYAVRLP